MKKNNVSLFSFLIAISMLLVNVPAAVAHTEEAPYATDLVAGNPKGGLVDAGDVLVWNDGENLYVKYVVSEDWFLTLTHLHVAESMAEIPQKNGNAVPGQFQYAAMNDDPLNKKEWTYTIPLGDWVCGDKLYIAAHAVVYSTTGQVADICALIGSLPETVDFYVINPDNPPPFSTAYFGIIISGESILAGTHPGWCIDTDHTIDQGPIYTANVYPTDNCPEDPAPVLPEGLVEYPENLDLVNWIINQNFVGQPSACDGVYTYGDVQRAIWALVEDAQSTDGIGPWSQCRVDEIVAAAYANGEGFSPGCGQKIAIILVPTGPIGSVPSQVVFIEYPMPCTPGDEETAWGYGLEFPGKNWAMYFTYFIQCPDGQ